MKSENPPPYAPAKPAKPRPAPLRLRCEAPGRRPFTVTLRGRRAEAVREAARRAGVTPGEAFRALVLCGMELHRGAKVQT